MMRHDGPFDHFTSTIAVSGRPRTDATGSVGGALDERPDGEGSEDGRQPDRPDDRREDGVLERQRGVGGHGEAAVVAPNTAACPGLMSPDASV